MIKKGQGALEFLMTYGWAFLVILIMIGALAYFGILNPKQFLPDRCSFGSEIQCRDHWMNQSDIKLKLVNNFGTTVNVSSMNATTPDGFSCAAVGPSLPFTWSEGSQMDINLTSCGGGGVISGDKFKFDVVVKWFDLKSSADYTHTTSGEVFRSVE